MDAADGYREVDSFSTLVKPRKNPKLSDYFVQLTKITQQQVDAEGKPFELALQDFLAFAEGGVLPVWGYGKSDGAVMEETARVQDVEFNRDAIFANGLNNIRPIFGRCGLEPWKWTSGSIHRALGLDMGKNHVHNALFDVRSLRVTLAELHRRDDPECGV